MTQTKQELRTALRAARRAHVAALDPQVRGLLFLRPPRALLETIGPGDVIGLYSATDDEAPAAGYARFFKEQGHTIALPRFAKRGAAMAFAELSDPFGMSDVEEGPYGVMQPHGEAEAITPDVLFVPLLGFTAQGERIGQGGGHYDRYLAAYPGTTAIGLAWDAQLVEALPVENHDVTLHAVVTPTRLFGPF